MMDLIYFGHGDDARHWRRMYLQEIAKDIPEIEPADAYDDVKGERLEIDIPNDQTELIDKYYVWTVGRAWFNSSLNVNLMMKDPRKLPEFKKYFEAAKARYPENFKKEKAPKDQ
jgi:hypothetical protein